jgi:hypothetical protein
MELAEDRVQWRVLVGVMFHLQVLLLDTRVYIHTHTHIYIYIYIYICLLQDCHLTLNSRAFIELNAK